MLKIRVTLSCGNKQWDFITCIVVFSSLSCITAPVIQHTVIIIILRENKISFSETCTWRFKHCNLSKYAAYTQQNHVLRYIPFHQCFIYTFNLSFPSISHTLTEPITICYTMEEHIKDSPQSLFWTATWPNKIVSTTIPFSIYTEK